MIKEKKKTVAEDELDKTRELPVINVSKGVVAEELEDDLVDAGSNSVPKSSLMANLVLEKEEPKIAEQETDASQRDVKDSIPVLEENADEQKSAEKPDQSEEMTQMAGSDQDEQEKSENEHQESQESTNPQTEKELFEPNEEAAEIEEITQDDTSSGKKDIEEVEQTSDTNQDAMEEVLNILNEEIAQDDHKKQEDGTDGAANCGANEAVDDDQAEEVHEQVSDLNDTNDGQKEAKELEESQDFANHEGCEVTKLTLEEKRKKELADKLTLEEKRAVDLNQKTLEEKRKEELEHALTLEEKRKKELADKMTIEEKRSLQKKGVTPAVEPVSLLEELKALFTKPTKFDLVSLLLLAVNVLLSGYVAFQINRYFSMMYALIFFVVMLLVFGITVLTLVKKRTIGMGINIVVLLMMIVASVLLLRVSGFADHVFDNSESETVMIVAKKESSLSESSDFKDQKIAFVKSDKDTNAFAEEMLKEEKKTGYAKPEYQTYQEAYDALLKDQVDMMVYTAYAKQRMEEAEIDSWSHVKVVLQKNREMKAVESKTVDITKDPFNVLISGVDLTSHGINEKGSSDVNIILTVNPNTKKMMMQTIPRDSWAPLTCKSGNHTKLTYAGAYGGIECSISTIEEMYDIEINYYAKINFKGVIDLVDALGGVTVNSDVSFCEAHPLDGYETRDYCYYAGENTINGVEALMFSRIRKVFADGDIERGKHQMEVVNAVVRKFKEEPTLDHMNGLLGAVEKNFTTNLSEDDIGKALTLFTKMGDQLNQIESYTMQGQMIWETDEVSGEYLYYFFPNEGQAEQFQQRIKDVMGGK